MFKRIISLFAVLVSVIVFGTINAFAEERGMNYLYTNACFSTLSVSGSTGTCGSCITCPSTTTKIEITQTLQVRDGNRWRTSQTWTKTVYGYAYDFFNTRTLYSGNTYRVASVFKVYRGTANETIYVYSDTKTV